MNRLLGILLVMNVCFTSRGQSDITIGANFSMNLQRENGDADAYILHNAKVDVSSPYAMRWGTSHPSFGSRGIHFAYLTGISFFADGVVTAAGSSFTPTTRMFIGNNGNVAIGATAQSGRLYVANGSNWLRIFPESVGVGDMLTIAGQQGKAFTVNALSPLQGKLITNLGVNYSIDGSNGTLQYATLGTKKSPVIQLNSEDGSISLFGENGTGANGRTPVLNRGIIVTGAGYVGIGSSVPDAQLTVNGSIHSKEVKIDLSVPGPDYVFEKGYTLPALGEIGEYIDKHKHLPDVPSAADMERNGVQLGEMNMILLKKVEELTLYVIELKKEVNELQEFSKKAPH